MFSEVSGKAGIGEVEKSAAVQILEAEGARTIKTRKANEKNDNQADEEPKKMSQYCQR